MRHGEIWTAAGGVYASKPRPVPIIQDDHFAATDSVTVIPITTTAVDAPLLRIPIDSTFGQRPGTAQPNHDRQGHHHPAIQRPRRMSFSVSSAIQRSTRLSHDELAGMKCTSKRG